MSGDAVLSLRKLGGMGYDRMSESNSPYLDFLYKYFQLYDTDLNPDVLSREEVYSRDNYEHVVIWNNLQNMFESIVEGLQVDPFDRSKLVSFLEYLHQTESFESINRLVPDPRQKVNIKTLRKDCQRVSGVFIAQIRVECKIVKALPNVALLDDNTVTNFCKSFAERLAVSKVRSDVERMFRGAQTVSRVDGLVSMSFSINDGEFAAALVSADTFDCKPKKDQSVM